MIFDVFKNIYGNRDNKSTTNDDLAIVIDLSIDEPQSGPLKKDI